MCVYVRVCVCMFPSSLSSSFLGNVDTTRKKTKKMSVSVCMGFCVISRPEPNKYTLLYALPIVDGFKTFQRVSSCKVFCWLPCRPYCISFFRLNRGVEKCNEDFQIFPLSIRTVSSSLHLLAAECNADNSPFQGSRDTVVGAIVRTSRIRTSPWTPK